MSPSLAEHLKQARHARFVGREGELNFSPGQCAPTIPIFTPPRHRKLPPNNWICRTYRRHLTAGIQRLTEMLWQQEIGER